MRRSSAIAVAAAIVALTGATLTGGTAIASSPERSAARSLFAGLSEPEIEAQSAFIKLANEAERLSPTTYAAAEWLGDKKSGGWISFTEPITGDVVALLEPLDFPVEVRVDAVMSRVQAENALFALRDELAAAGVTQYTLATDTDLDEVSLTVPESSTYARSNLSGFQQTADELLPAEVEVAVTTSESAGLDEQYLHGGGWIMDSNGPNCTAGFTAIRGSQWGILTAGHCPDTNQMIRDSTYPLNTVQEHSGTYGDGQFMASADPQRFPWIYIDNQGTFQWIDGTADAVVGAYVANAGRTRSGLSAATVEDVNVCIDGRCSLVRTNGTFTNNGDSGGPWVHANWAVGIHTGEQSGKAVFSRVHRLMAVLSTEVWLG